jgi:hypothetical protein
MDITSESLSIRQSKRDADNFKRCVCEHQLVGTKENQSRCGLGFRIANGAIQLCKNTENNVQTKVKDLEDLKKQKAEATSQANKVNIQTSIELKEDEIKKSNSTRDFCNNHFPNNDMILKYSNSIFYLKKQKEKEKELLLLQQQQQQQLEQQKLLEKEQRKKELLKKKKQHKEYLLKQEKKLQEKQELERLKVQEEKEKKRVKTNILLKKQRMLLLDTIALLIPKKEVKFIGKIFIMLFLNLPKT